MQMIFKLKGPPSINISFRRGNKTPEEGRVLKFCKKIIKNVNNSAYIIIKNILNIK